MSERLKRNALLLKALYHAKPSKRKDILKHCSPDFLQALCELSLNLLKGHLKVSPSQYRQLNRQKNIIRLLADKKTSLKRKHQVLKKQTGGFILPLLSAAVPILGNLLGGLIPRS